MKADISRSTFKKSKHYRKVNLQQGRVQTDADWNEQIDIQVHHEKTSLQDIIGRTGAPSENAGFEIKLDPSKLGYTIGAGHYYVDGILCENENDIQCTDQVDLKPLYFIWDDIFSNEQASARFRNFLKEIFAFDWIVSEGIQVESTDNGRTIRIHTPNASSTSNSISVILDNEPSKATKAIMRDDKEAKVVYEFVSKIISNKLNIGYTPALPTGQGTYLVYLDVWERHLTWLDDPEMREVALLGPDTTTRTKMVCQVKLLSVQSDGEESNCQSKFPSWDELLALPTGTLHARAEPPEPAKEPCELPPQAGYRRLQNQLYRIEIHDEGESNNGATFKWSRENGAIVSRVYDIISSENKIMVNDTGRDSRLGFVPLQWVEVIDDRRESWGLQGTLVQLGDVEDNNTLVFNAATVKGDALNNENFPQEFNPKVRRWDSDGALEVQVSADNDGHIELEDGVQVKFSGGTYKTGDYWLIPARTATASIEWPKVGAGNDAAFLMPEGITHHLCRLALLKYVDGSLTLVDDCRQFFTPASALTLHYVSGDGQEAPAGNALQSGLKALVTTGDQPVAGVKIQFQIQVGNGTIDPHEGTDLKTSTATSDLNGFVSCRWTLGDNPLSQQVKATLLNDNSSTMAHLPLYFNANLIQLEATATTGIINLRVSPAILQTPGQDRVIFGPFEHFLNGLSTPPAVMLALASDNELGNQKTEVMFMEDYDLYKISSVALRFKSVGIDLRTFKISFPFDVVTELAKLERKIGIRWWAVPAQEQKPQIGNPIEAPTILFDPPGPPTFINIPSSTARVIITDSSANARPDMVDVVTINLSAGNPAVGPGIDVDAIETDQNSGKFVTKDIQIVSGNSIAVGDKIFQLIGMNPELPIVATYGTHAADGSQIIVRAQATIEIFIAGPGPLAKVVFSTDNIAFHEPTAVTITDPPANKDPNKVDHVVVSLGSMGAEDVIKNIDAAETGPNTGVFMTQEIKVTDDNSVSIGQTPVVNVPGAKGGGALVLKYKDTGGNVVKGIATIKPQ